MSDKKGKAILPQEQSSLVSVEESDSDDSEQAPQRYVCTGTFQDDFTQLCQVADMIVVPPVVRRPAFPQQPKPEKKSTRVATRRRSLLVKAKEKNMLAVKDDRRPSLTNHKASQSTITTDESETGSETFTPTTFTLKDKFQYFKPRVQVEFSESEESGTVTEIYIRDWRVDVTMMKIFMHCLPALEHLHLLHLWNVGLNPETLDILLSFLPRCQKLTSLTLDANPLGKANVSNLINVNSHLKDLSLRFCEVNDIHAHGIGVALGTTKTWNKKLLSLNLSNNKIGDVGACQIAHGLKTNRTLLTLNLTGNQIGDEGATALAETLSQFALDDEQMHERRMKLSPKEKLGLSFKIQPKRRCPKEVIFAMLERRKKRKDKENKTATQSPPRVRTSSTLCKLSDGRRVSGGSESKRNLRRQKSKKTLITDVVEWHPLMDAGNLYKGKFWVLGNRSLISLNLSRNRIEEKGMSQLLEMVQVQAVPCHEQQQTGTGLKRLVVNRNAVAMDNATLQALNHLMVTKDPMYRMPFVGLDRTNVPPCAMPPITI